MPDSEVKTQSQPQPPAKPEPEKPKPAPAMAPTKLSEPQKAAASPVAQKPPAPQPEKPVESKSPAAPVWKHNAVVTVDNVKDIVYAEPADGVMPFRGVCLKCGWQSYQPTKKAAEQSVVRHAGKHITGGQ